MSQANVLQRPVPPACVLFKYIFIFTVYNVHAFVSTEAHSEIIYNWVAVDKLLIHYFIGLDIYHSLVYFVDRRCL